MSFCIQTGFKKKDGIHALAVVGGTGGEHINPSLPNNNNNNATANVSPPKNNTLVVVGVPSSISISEASANNKRKAELVEKMRTPQSLQGYTCGNPHCIDGFHDRNARNNHQQTCPQTGNNNNPVQVVGLGGPKSQLLVVSNNIDKPAAPPQGQNVQTVLVAPVAKKTTPPKTDSRQVACDLMAMYIADGNLQGEKDALHHFNSNI